MNDTVPLETVDPETDLLDAIDRVGDLPPDEIEAVCTRTFEALSAAAAPDPHAPAILRANMAWNLVQELLRRLGHWEHVPGGDERALKAAPLIVAYASYRLAIGAGAVAAMPGTPEHELPPLIVEPAVGGYTVSSGERVVGILRRRRPDGSIVLEVANSPRLSVQIASELDAVEAAANLGAQALGVPIPHAPMAPL